MTYKESEVVELKKSLAQLKEGIISLSSMLNKHGEGTVYFGIDDNGTIVGLDIGKKTKSDVIHELINNLKPLPATLNVDLNEENKIIIVHVEGKDAPYSAYKRYYIRLGDSDVSMANEQLKLFFEKQKDTNIERELAETCYDEKDIDENRLLANIRNSNEIGRMDYVYKNAHEALVKLGLLTENNKLNNAGYYLFSSKKPLKIKLALYPTDDRTEFGEIKTVQGNIYDCIDEAISYVNNHIIYKSNIVGSQTIQIPEIPLKAIREIVINSFAHRDYRANIDDNQISIYRSQIRIYNPGPIVHNLDPKVFANGEVNSKLRNPIIADVLYKNGYIDAFGTGFDRTFTLCKERGINYEYFNDEFGFTFIFKRIRNFLDDRLNDRINDRINDSLNDRINQDFSNLDKQILDKIRMNKYITIDELAKALKMSSSTINRHLKTLTTINAITRVGSKKNGYWKVNS